MEKKRKTIIEGFNEKAKSKWVREAGTGRVYDSTKEDPILKIAEAQYALDMERTFNTKTDVFEIIKPLASRRNEYKGKLKIDVGSYWSYASLRILDIDVSKMYALKNILHHYRVDIKEKIIEPKDFTKEKFVEKKSKVRTDKKIKYIYTSLYINKDDNIFAEQIVNKNGSQFCIYNTETKEISYEDFIDCGDIVYCPIVGEEIEKKAVLLPSETEEYGTYLKLNEEIKEFINKWLDIPEKICQFALWNIKRSWVYERFHTINYLRALGDTGVGKSRFLDVLGLLHYKPIATSGATTSAPVFRIIDKWKGSIIMDEADFGQSDESQDIIKIINMGYEKGKFIMRCDQNDASKMNFFDPFCPKVIATRRTFTDKAVESRCITHVMTGTTRKDIPYNINDKFWAELQIIRNKLLLWRFRNYYKIEPEQHIDMDLGDLEPRVKQIVTSVVSLFGNDTKQINEFKEFILNYQEELIDERKSSFDGEIVGAIHQLTEQGIADISASDIIEKAQLKNRSGNLISSRGISSSLKSLGFGKTLVRKVDGKAKRCVNLDPLHLVSLFKRYGYTVTVVTASTETPEEIVKN